MEGRAEPPALVSHGEGPTSSSQQLRDAPGFGLLNIRERIELLGGRMKIRSAVGDRMDIMVELHSLWTPRPAKQIFKALERSRNVIMHGGELSMNDIERVAMNIRDWVNQVGG